MCSCRIKEHIGNSELSFFKQQGEHHFFRRTALVHRLDKFTSANILTRFQQFKVAFTAGIRLIADHYACPLLIAHRIGS